MDEVEVEQYSEQSRSRLREASTALVELLQHHTTTLLAQHGADEETEQLFDLNDAVREAAVAWEDAVFDHTGTFPLALELFEDEEDEVGLPVEKAGRPAAEEGSVADRQ